MTTNKEKWEIDFDEQLVEMSLFMGRDMHNRPPLYELEDNKIEEIKNFIHNLLSSQLEEAKRTERSRMVDILKDEKLSDEQKLDKIFFGN